MEQTSSTYIAVRVADTLLYLSAAVRCYISLSLQSDRLPESSGGRQTNAQHET